MHLNPRAEITALMVGLVSACSGGDGEGAADPNSQQLVAISHKEPTLNALLSISYDGSYNFLDHDARKEARGRLSADELSELEGHVSPAAIQGLVAQQVPDEACGDAAVYVVLSKYGNACVVSTEISDVGVRAHADFLIELFSSTAAAAAAAP